MLKACRAVRAGLEALVALTKGPTRAAAQHRDRFRTLGAVLILPTLMSGSTLADKDGQLLCLRATESLIERCPANADKLLGLDIVWAISLAMHRHADDQDLQALGTALLGALHAEPVPPSELVMKVTQLGLTSRSSTMRSSASLDTTKRSDSSSGGDTLRKCHGLVR